MDARLYSLLFASGRWREEWQVKVMLCIASTEHCTISPCTKEEQLSKLGLGHGREHTNIWTDPKRAGCAGWLSSAAVSQPVARG